jgi:hypothetical protein
MSDVASKTSRPLIQRTVSICWLHCSCRKPTDLHQQSPSLHVLIISMADAIRGSLIASHGFQGKVHGCGKASKFSIRSQYVYALARPNVSIRYSKSGSCYKQQCTSISSHAYGVSTYSMRNPATSSITPSVSIPSSSRCTA